MNNLFSGLTLVCKGDANMTMGNAAIRMVPAANAEEWEVKASSIRKLYAATMGRHHNWASSLTSESNGRSS